MKFKLQSGKDTKKMKARKSSRGRFSLGRRYKKATYPLYSLKRLKRTTCLNRDLKKSQRRFYCSICHMTDQFVKAMPNCGAGTLHKFHEHCLRKQCEYRHKCPLDRAPISHYYIRNRQVEVPELRPEIQSPQPFEMIGNLQNQNNIADLQAGIEFNRLMEGGNFRNDETFADPLPSQLEIEAQILNNQQEEQEQIFQQGDI